MKKEETSPRTWEAVDPKPPVVHSGHLESQTRKIALDKGQTLG